MVSLLYNEEQLRQLLYQALDTVTGRVELYTEALKCTIDEELANEWETYLGQARDHRSLLIDLFERIRLDVEAESAGRGICRHINGSLAHAIRMARHSGSDRTAQMVAAECIVLAETRDRVNWELIADVARQCAGPVPDLLCDVVADSFRDDGHKLYTTKAFLRELWLYSLGLPAVKAAQDDEFDNLRPDLAATPNGESAGSHY